MFMGLLQDLRNARNERTKVERNTETIGRELNRDLSKDDLLDMINLMDAPEVHNPLFVHAEAFGRQPEMDDVLRMKFRLRAADILGRENHDRLSDVMNRFGRAEMNEEDTQDNRRLVDKLLLTGRDDEPYFVDKVTDRIRQTRQDINDRVEYQKQKIKGRSKEFSQSVERRVRPFVDVAHDSVRGIIQGVKTRVQSFKDDYRTRQRSIENAQNWEAALDKGVSADQIKGVIDHADFPEVRYGVMKHASKLFEQDSMTPELATDLFYAYQPHTNAQNKDHERFYTHLETYAKNVVELAEEDTSSVGPSETPQAQGTETEQSDSNEALYDTAVESNRTEQNTTPDSPKQTVTSEDKAADSWLSEYGDSDTIKFESSQTLSRLMARQGMDRLPDLAKTSDEMDVRQAQLLGISQSGDAVWGVPDNGEIRHLSDEELESAFMAQYGEPVAEQDVSLPEYLSIPPEPDLQEGYSFFDQLADEFNQQWNDEEALMQEGAPDEYYAPPLQEEDDVPPLSFDGLEENAYEYER